MEGIPESAVKAVAKKLKHYIDVERREEGFDLSGHLNPLGEFHFGRGLGGTLHYNSLQDKHLQRYFQQPSVRKHLVDMGVVAPGAFERCDMKHKRSKSAGHKPSSGLLRLKSDQERLMENSAKLLLACTSRKQGFTGNKTIKKLSSRESGSYSSLRSHQSASDSEENSSSFVDNHTTPQSTVGSMDSSQPSQSMMPTQHHPTSNMNHHHVQFENHNSSSLSNQNLPWTGGPIQHSATPHSNSPQTPLSAGNSSIGYNFHSAQSTPVPPPHPHTVAYPPNMYPPPTVVIYPPGTNITYPPGTTAGYGYPIATSTAGNQGNGTQTPTHSESTQTEDDFWQ